MDASSTAKRGFPGQSETFEIGFPPKADISEALDCAEEDAQTEVLQYLTEPAGEPAV